MRHSLKTAVLSVLSILVGVLMLAPYIVMIVTSATPSNELGSIPPRFLPTHWDFSSYLSVWTVAPIGDYLKSSFIVASASTLIVLLVSVPAAYATARFKFRGRRLYLGAVMAAQMMAPVALVVGLYQEFESLNLLDTYLALIIINAAFNLSFATWLLRGFVLTIPASMEEAAWIDGCSKPRALVSVVLPSLRPGLVTAGVYAFIVAWNEFIVALTIISSESKKPIQVGITEFIGQNQVDWQHLFAASIVAIVPIVLLFAAIEKHLVGGLTAGSVK